MKILKKDLTAFIDDRKYDDHNLFQEVTRFEFFENLGCSSYSDAIEVSGDYVVFDFSSDEDDSNIRFFKSEDCRFWIESLVDGEKILYSVVTSKIKANEFYVEEHILTSIDSVYMIRDESGDLMNLKRIGYYIQ